MKLAKQQAASGLLAGVKGCASWLSKRALGCAQPQVQSFGKVSVLARVGTPKPQRKPGNVGLEAPDADDEWASFDWALRSSCADYYYNAEECDGADDNTSSAGPCTEAAVEDNADAEVDTRLESIALACIDVPYLDPKHKQRPPGATLLQHSPCSSAWVASLWAPVDAAGSGGTWRQQRMLVKIHKFYSDEAVAKAQAAAARHGNGGQQQKLHVPTERDAMQETRMAVKLACTSVRRIRGPAFYGAASPAPGGASDPSDGGRLGCCAPPLLPLHLEVRPCADKRPKGGPDREIVVVYPYFPATTALDGVGALGDDPVAEPRGQERVRTWLHSSP